MRTILALAPLALLGACAAGPDFAHPEAPAPAAGYAGDGAGRAILADGPEREWWKAFQSPEMDALVARALASNRSLAASKATLASAQERIAAVAGRRLPQVDATARAEYQQVNLSAFGLSNSLAGGIGGLGNPRFDLYSLGAGVSYDLDLFGRNRRALEQTAAQAEAQQRQTEAAHLLIAGRVVQQVLAIAALGDRIATERALLGEDERNFRLTKARQEGGVGTMVEVLSAEGQLAADRANLPAFEQSLAEARAMLAVLLGLSPAELEPTPFKLADFALPAQVPVALPSALVRKRPDILEAEARLHAATAAIGMAEAELYPNVALGATLTQSTSEPDRILSSTFRGFDIFAGLNAPIFHGGTLKAQKRGAEAEARAAAATYQQVVLEAFGQVSGLLSALDTDSRALAAQQRAAEIADRSLYLSRRSFQVGNSGVLQVLDASRSYQRAQIALLEVRARQYVNVARLHAATAGGWIDETVPQQSAPASFP